MKVTLNEIMNRRFFLFLAFLFSGPAILLNAGKEFDPVDWALGGLRGQVIAPSTDQYPFQTEQPPPQRLCR